MGTLVLTLRGLALVSLAQQANCTSNRISDPSLALAGILLAAHAPSTSVYHSPPCKSPSHQPRIPMPTMLDIPRVTLPEAVSRTLKDLDLKDPNELTERQYNEYSAAAILGTIVFFLLPGAALTDLKFAPILTDLGWSALLGGGLAAYLALRQDKLGEKANEFGDLALRVISEFPRFDVPNNVANLLKEQGLKSPNELTKREYNTYSGAAVLGTFIFFTLPGAAIFHADLVNVITNFIFSALSGGGIGAYAALRKDDFGMKANFAGASFLRAVESVLNRL